MGDGARGLGGGRISTTHDLPVSGADVNPPIDPWSTSAGAHVQLGAAVCSQGREVAAAVRVSPRRPAAYPK